jgi:DNA-binding NtrC family response regulator
VISSLVKYLKHYKPWWVSIIEAIMVQVVEYKSTSHGKRFVAIVNDYAELAHLFRDALSQIEGAEVLAFTDPKIALEHFNLNYREYAVLISDCVMPGMNGLDFLERAKKTWPSVITIYTCGCGIYYEDQLLKYCDFVDKHLPIPITMPDLIREVKECVRVSKINKNRN